MFVRGKQSSWNTVTNVYVYFLQTLSSRDRVDTKEVIVRGKSITLLNFTERYESCSVSFPVVTSRIFQPWSVS